jgi:regulator of nucleoside diphosphate kinase
VGLRTHRKYERPCSTNHDRQGGVKCQTDVNMSKRDLVISEFDRVRLEELIEKLTGQNDKHSWPNGEKLSDKLTSAKVVAPTQIPADVITIDSIVRVLDLETKRESVHNLVLPSGSNPLEGRISVMSSLGIALLGCRIGDEIEWQTPTGLKLQRIVGVIYQPEAAGHWTL